MPELIECFTMAKQVNEKFKNSFLTNIHFEKPPGKKTKNCTYDTLDQLKKLFPLKLTNVYSHGKKIILQLDKETYVIISPLMTGSLIFKKANHCHTHFMFESKNDSKDSEDSEEDKDRNDSKDDKDDTDDNMLYFNDTLHQGLVNTYFDKKSFDLKMSEIGPDWLSGIVTLDYFKKIISNKRIKNQQVVLFIMDQKRTSGIGNYMKAEILYDCKMYPGTLLLNLTDSRITDLYNSIIKIVKLASEGFGLTIKNYVTPNGEVGTFDTKVYGKEKDPEGNLVVKETFKDNRTTHWVKEVQI